jgi:acetyltransferase-like isoleucine patch superfamily enzyme
MRTVAKPPVWYRVRITLARLRSALVHRRAFAALGSGSFLESPQLVIGHKNISIGARTSIRTGARIEAHQRMAHRVPQLTIGSDTNIEQDVHIMCHSRVSIGDRVSITGRCAIVDVTHPVGPDVTKIGDEILDEDSYVEIADEVFLGIGTVVLPNVRIGRGAVIGANSVVTCDIPEFAIAAGAPARVIGNRRDRTSDGT